MAVNIKCPFCKTKFPWAAKTDAYPKFCPECGESVGHNRADDDVVVPKILHFTTRCQDGVYKAMEKSSEERMYAAAEMAGTSPSEMASLKITNMRDNMRQGDIAAMPVVNDVTRQMDQMRAMNPNAQIGFGVDASAGSEYAAGAASGRIANGVSGSILPRQGSRVLGSVREQHNDRAAQVLNQSYLNRGLL